MKIFTNDSGAYTCQVSVMSMPLYPVSLHTSKVAHQAGAYPDFPSTKRLGVFLLPPEWDASPLQGYPQH